MGKKELAMRGQPAFAIIATMLVAAVAPPPGRAGDPLVAAEKAYESGDYGTAYDNARKATRQGPENARAYYLAGASAFQLTGISDRKIERDLTQCLELEPETPLAHYLLGYLAFRNAGRIQGEPKESERRSLYSEAASQFEAELALQPGFIKALEGRAIALQRAGAETDRVLSAHEAWITATPTMIAPYLSLARTCLHGRGVDDALSVAEEMSAGEPQFRSRLLLGFAVVLFQENRTEEVEGVLRGLEPDAVAICEHSRRLVLHLIRNEESQVVDVLDTMLESGLSDAEIEVLRAVFSAVSRESFEKILEPLMPTQKPSQRPGRTEPLRIEHVFPEYPDKARQRRVESAVSMLVLVPIDGKPRVLGAVSNSPGYGFESTSVEAVERWRFRPATEDGQAVPSIIVVITTFDVS